MKIKGFCLEQFIATSPKLLQLGQFRFPLRFFSKSASDQSSGEQIKLKKIRKIKRLDDALSLYDTMAKMRPSPSVTHFNQLLLRLVYPLKEYSSAICIFRDMASSGISLDDTTLNIAINCYCLSNRIDYGFSIMGWFYKLGSVPDGYTFNAILKGLFREKKIVEAQMLFRKIVRERPCELDAHIYCTVLDELCKAGNTAEAIELLGAMDYGLKIFDQISEKRIKLDVITYTTLICGLCNLGRWREVKILLNETTYCELVPNVVTFNTIIDLFCKEDLIDEAANVLRVMIRKNVVPSVVSYNSIMDGYCQQGRIDMARSIFDFMASKDIAPNMDTLNISSALMGFDELQAIGPKPDFYTYCNLLSGLCRNQKAKQALLLLDKLEDQGENLHVAYYNIVMDRLCRSKEFQMAQAIFHDLPIKGLRPNVKTYNSMICGFCENGLMQEAKEVILKMQQEGVLPDGMTYNVIVQGNLLRGEYEDTAKFLEEMGAIGFSPSQDTYDLLVVMSCSHKPKDDWYRHEMGIQTCMETAMELRSKLDLY